MYGDHDPGGQSRVAAGAATLAIHAGLAALLIWGLAQRNVPEAGDTQFVSIDLEAPPPPSPPPPPSTPDAAPAAATDEPAPEGMRGEALPREAPEAAIPLAVAPAAPVAGSGADVNAGSGSQGPGSGAGGAGDGNGGGGLGSPAQRIAGALSDSDYPRGAERDGLAGTVGIRFRVRTDGAVDRCEIVRSSGAALLDDLTCRLFTQRFRFRPATDASGRAIESSLQTSFTWGTRRRR